MTEYVGVVTARNSPDATRGFEGVGSIVGICKFAYCIKHFPGTVNSLEKAVVEPVDLFSSIGTSSEADNLPNLAYPSGEVGVMMQQHERTTYAEAFVCFRSWCQQ